jgi:hypothetical protein
MESSSLRPAAELARVLDDQDRAFIGNPRRGGYAVSFIASDVDEANAYARQLASLGMIPTTNISYDGAGEVRRAYVTLYKAPDQKRLLEAVGDELSSERREALDELVTARGPVPTDIRERMQELRTRGWSDVAIADRLNEHGILAGRGPRPWTAGKVKEALAPETNEWVVL